MLLQLLSDSGLSFSPDQIEKFEKFLQLFQEKNAVVNLSAIRAEKDIIIKHFLDSLEVTKLLPYQEASTIIDLGTGGGFPGIPLAILSPEKQFLLVDSVQKKINSIKFFIQKLGLSNAKTIVGRAEEIGAHKDHREHYDLCVSRSVAYLPTLLEYCLPLIKINGYFVAYKEPSEEEIRDSQNALATLGGTIDTVHTYTLPGLEQERNLILVKKTEKTPGTYPREIGTPSKKPL